MTICLTIKLLISPINYQLRSLDQGGLSLQCIIVRKSNLSNNDHMSDYEALVFNYQHRPLDQGGLSLQCIIVRTSMLSNDDNMSDYKALDKVFGSRWS